MQSRRHFIRGLAGVSALAVGGCCSVSTIGAGSDRIRLAVVGIEGQGYWNWMPMVRSGLAEIVAFCDADATQLPKALAKAATDLPDLDLSGVPFYSDYRKLLDDCDRLNIQAMTISTPDHLHAPVAIRAMKMGIHVYVEAPLVRTLWELDSFSRTAKECGVLVQMGNQNSALDSLRRLTEILQSDILGDVREVHVWTDRPAWPQGRVLADYIRRRGNQGDPIPEGLDWDSFLGPAKERAYLGRIPDSLGSFPGDEKLSPNVYHTVNWRGSVDFGVGALGAAGCHLMNLPFRGLELGAVTEVECTMIEGSSDLLYPTKSIVRMSSAARVAQFGNKKGKTLPAVTLFWYDGGEKPSAEVMPKGVLARGGRMPSAGACIIGAKGTLIVRDAACTKATLVLASDKTIVEDAFQHEATKAIGETIPKIGETGHGLEFLRAIRGEGHVYEQTQSRCFSDIEHGLPLMSSVLVGSLAQRIPDTKLVWNPRTQTFNDSAANALIRPYIRSGFEF